MRDIPSIFGFLAPTLGWSNVCVGCDMGSGLGREGEWVGGWASYLAMETEDISEVFCLFIDGATADVAEFEQGGHTGAKIIVNCFVIVKKRNFRSLTSYSSEILFLN